jgi:hypothetical protein
MTCARVYIVTTDVFIVAIVDGNWLDIGVATGSALRGW